MSQEELRKARGNNVRPDVPTQRPQQPQAQPQPNSNPAIKPNQPVSEPKPND